MANEAEQLTGEVIAEHGDTETFLIRDAYGALHVEPFNNESIEVVGGDDEGYICVSDKVRFYADVNSPVFELPQP